MATTWILVAHRGGARIFENTGPGKGMQRIDAVDHPEGRLKNGDINSDKPGRAFDSFGGGRHSMSKENDPKEQLAQQFARSLADKMHLGRSQNRFENLVLVAEPGFHGELRAALDSPTASLVSTTLGKDLGNVEDRDLPAHLDDAVRL